jgi:hypothetical protein
VFLLSLVLRSMEDIVRAYVCDTQVTFHTDVMSARLSWLRDIGAEDPENDATALAAGICLTRLRNN